MAQECPRCGLVSPQDTRRCDCGYDFVTRTSVEAQHVGWQELLFSLDGRIGRAAYWLVLSTSMAAYLVLFALDLALGTVNETEKIGLLSGIFLLLAAYPSIAVGVKRCHDRDRSGWFMLGVPLANIWLLVELGFLRGTPGINRFGPPRV
jgi:uncharacterized membrane protein YhaH (DUF805 family)